MAEPLRKPPWVIPAAAGPESAVGVHRLLRGLGLTTVCEEARCPNRGECFGRGTAAFLILGQVCTRACGFCAVARGAPGPPDHAEPAAVAEAVRRLGLAHVVVTSVTRDDLPDGGAAHFATTVRALRHAAPAARVEVLVPDFGGSAAALEEVLASAPEVLNHNLETVPSLYARVRPGADYARSLALLGRARALAPGRATKSGLMVGLGEDPEEVRAVMRDLAAAGCSSLTIGQYLQPRRESLPVVRYLRPGEFAALREEGLAAGLAQVIAGPLVRSSYHAGEAYHLLRG